MTPEALRAALGRLELSQGAAARLLGVDARTMRRWLAGDRAIPEIAVRLLGVIEHVPKARPWLLHLARSHTQAPAPEDWRRR